jgi:ribosomal-protein-alanine N-acetyltransferase
MCQETFENFISDRLILRRIDLSDASDMYEYTSNPEVCKYLEWDAHTEKDQVVSFINLIMDEYETDNTKFLWGIELLNEKKLIGVLRIFDLSIKNHRGEVSYILNPNYQGKGYMVESLKAFFSYCFRKTDIIRIQAKCVSDHKASEKVMINSGMSYEGLLKNYFILEDKSVDAVLYAITLFQYNDSYLKSI